MRPPVNPRIRPRRWPHARAARAALQPVNRAVPRRGSYAGRSAAVAGRGTRAAEQVSTVDGLTRRTRLKYDRLPEIMVSVMYSEEVGMTMGNTCSRSRSRTLSPAPPQSPSPSAASALAARCVFSRVWASANCRCDGTKNRCVACHFSAYACLSQPCLCRFTGIAESCS